jgi:BirA family transcriptional regulator, biotin operon repressor / biotin---[acetyl-CoA-carboxylase] ligase
MARQSADRFRNWGLDLEFDASGRCRLNRPLDLLDRRRLIHSLEAAAPDQLGRLIIATELRSTSDELLRDNGAREETSKPVAESCVQIRNEPCRHTGDGWLDVCIAEFQSAGRGRRGRRWQAPLASGLCLSVGCRLATDPASLSMLPLVAGVTVRRVLRELTGVDVALKWPNDLVWKDRKLGGILVERTMSGTGSGRLVIGLGLNVDLPDFVREAVSDWPEGAVDLAAVVRSCPSAAGERCRPDRTEIAAALVTGLGLMLSDVRAGVLPAWQDEWHAADNLIGRCVRITQESGDFTGTALGVDETGALLVEGEDGMTRRVSSADVSVRSEPTAVVGTAVPKPFAVNAP